jgi:hypothetical protein
MHPLIWAQNRVYTEARLLGFSYDFGLTVIRHQNADTMVLASALMRGIPIPPLDVRHFEYYQGGECLSYPHWLGSWRQHFDDKSWRGSGYAFLAESTFCVSLFCDLGHKLTIYDLTKSDAL